MRPTKEFNAILMVGVMNGGTRQVEIWKIFDRWCHGVCCLPTFKKN